MTISHLLFAAAMTAYILIAIPLEERDLAAQHGSRYLDYQGSVGRLFPRWVRRRRTLPLTTQSENESCKVAAPK